MSVNLSGRQLDDPVAAEQVRAAIDAAAAPRPEPLKLEITESTLMQEIERTQHVFSEVCLGVGLHLDDFGTGYSSLTALHRFPVDALKIDRSFVSTISCDGEQGSDVIVRSTVALAHSLGLPVIAEGIEAPDQLRRLRSLGCEFGQGYLFSPALNAKDTRLLLESWSPSDGHRPGLAPEASHSPPAPSAADRVTRGSRDPPSRVDDAEVAFRRARARPVHRRTGAPARC